MNVSTLSEALRHYYSLAEPLRPTEPPEGCRCCVDPAKSAQLLAVPLRELTEHELGPYWSKAVTTWGDTSDFRYFLPRILELASRSESLIDLPWLGAKLEDAGWLSWPPEEVSAIRSVLRSLWCAWLSSEPSEERSLDELLGLIGAAEDDLGPYIELYGELDPSVPAKHIRAYLEHVPAGQLSGSLTHSCKT